MSLFYPDKIKSSNPSAYGIVDAKEVAGSRKVAQKSDLYAISPNILSTDGNGADAEGQIWYVSSEQKFYALISFANRAVAAGWLELQMSESEAFKNAIAEDVFSSEEIQDSLSGTGVTEEHAFDLVQMITPQPAEVPQMEGVAYDNMSIDQIKYLLYTATQKINFLVKTVEKLMNTTTAS
jgi:hypothetical protein